MNEQAYVVKPQSRVDIRTYAAALRSLAKQPSGRFDIMNFLEFSLPKISPAFDLQIKSKSELQDNLGLTQPDRFIIQLRDDIYARAWDGDGFARMTVAHELGHFVMHSESKLGFARTLASITTPKFMNSEWQANCFAGELLVPYADRELISRLGVILTSQEYGVSMTAAECQHSVFSIACREDASAPW